MQIFHTDRFIIRRLVESDIEAFHDMQGNPHVMRYVKPAMTREESARELKRFMNYYDDADIQFDIWAIEQKSNNEFVGICGVYKNDQSETEIAYRLREAHWRRGIASEVTKGLIKYCFTYSDIDKLYAYVRLGNEGSIRILEMEMNFARQFYSEKGASEERLYMLNKDQWESKQDYLIAPVNIANATPLTELTIRSKAHWNYGDDQINKWLPDLTITTSSIADNFLYKLVNDNGILGYYSLIHHSDTVVKMDNLFIEPSCIGQGYGSVLLEDAFQRARLLEYQKMTLDADPHAAAFYLKRGFKVVGQLPTSIEGRFLPIMERKLKRF